MSQPCLSCLRGFSLILIQVTKIRFSLLPWVIRIVLGLRFNFLIDCSN